jgi:hypothetical protein
MLCFRLNSSSSGERKAGDPSEVRGVWVPSVMPGENTESTLVLAAEFRLEGSRMPPPRPLCGASSSYLGGITIGTGVRRPSLESLDAGRDSA